MMTATPPKLDDIPLWRLLVALHDAERTVGPDSPTTRILARAVQRKLREQPADELPPCPEGGEP
jgi:hypothetical protein